MFLSGLNTIIDASSYTPITQAKSTVGTIAGGQKKGFLESDHTPHVFEINDKNKLAGEINDSDLLGVRCKKKDCNLIIQTFIEKELKIV